MSGTPETPDPPAPFTPVPVSELIRQPPVLEGKPRSGYARVRAKFRYIVGRYEELRSEYVDLERAHDALKVGHAELQLAFDELLSIHNGLLTDLKQSHQVRSAASSFDLMGQRQIGGHV